MKSCICCFWRSAWHMKEKILREYCLKETHNPPRAVRRVPSGLAHRRECFHLLGAGLQPVQPMAPDVPGGENSSWECTCHLRSPVLMWPSLDVLQSQNTLLHIEGKLTEVVMIFPDSGACLTDDRMGAGL